MCLKRLLFWPVFNQLQLTENVRTDHEEPDFKNWLMDIGNDTSRIYDAKYMVRLLDCVFCQKKIFNKVFGDGPLDLLAQDRLNNAILCPTVIHLKLMK